MKKKQRDSSSPMDLNVATSEGTTPLNNTILSKADFVKYEQGNKNDVPRGSITFGPNGINIDLLKDADPSTFIHETGHFYLKLLGDLAAMPNVTERIKGDYKTILDWLGAKEDEPLTVGQHEKFARGVEAYFMEGNVPSERPDWRMEIEDKIKGLPASPGVYIMKGRDGEVLYIGKAKSLKDRVRSYFVKSGDTRYTVRFLASRVEDIDYIVTANEKEALLLEDILLKQHKPRYNIRLKDSKTYVSIKITVNERFPRIFTTRQVKKDGARYFGPYISAYDVRETIKFLRKIFPLCVCSENVFRNRVRPCLDYQMGICSAPAVGLISEEAYRELVDGAIMFLEGKNKELLKILKQRMREAADNLDFEKAGRLRDRIAAIEEMLEEQKVVTHRFIDQDVFAVVRDGGTVAIQALFIRDGRLLSGNSYFFRDSGLPGEEVISSFITEFYRGERFVPDEVIIPLKTEDAQVLREWLREKKGRNVSVILPVKGDRLKLLKMAGSNASEALRKKTGSRQEPDIINELKNRLNLRNMPNNIEAFDISNIGGKQAVGAMVEFKGGMPDKSSYRLFKIRGLSTPDDYAMMHEVLSRRYRNVDQKEAGAERPGKTLPLPDLMLIDGGKGQLNIAVQVLRELGIAGVDVAALAKDKNGEPIFLKGKIPKGERVYLPNVKDPVYLKEGSRPDLLLRRIRDEVHRFAISYHRRLRAKGVSSALDQVKGIGEKKKKALFERFGDLEGICSAPVAELIKVPGITGKLAEEIKNLPKP